MVEMQNYLIVYMIIYIFTHQTKNAKHIHYIKVLAHYAITLFVIFVIDMEVIIMEMVHVV